MKTRRHHNNTGLTQIKRGRTELEIRSMAQRLGVPYRVAGYQTATEPSQEDSEVAGDATITKETKQ